MLPANILQNIVRYNANRRQRIREDNIQRRILRDASDPFSLRDENFIETFRLTKDMARHVLGEIEPYLVNTQNPVAVPNLLKLLVALHFHATGCYQRPVGQNYMLNMSQSKISRIISEVSLAIGHIANQWIRFPRTPAEKQQIKGRFMEQTNFPGTVGAIDGTHVALIAPSVEEHNYLNRKGYHSKNVQIICDYDMKILNINCRYDGAAHDSYIWRNSIIQMELEGCYNRGDRNTWLVGDSGYPQQCCLMTPIVNARPGTPQFNYTQAQMRARNCVEKCTGVLKGRFRCLSNERKLRYSPDKVAQIIISCGVLHNICIDRHLDIPFNIVNEDVNMNMMQNIAYNQPGQQARANLIQTYFQ
ncbi:hypothetical protein MML48_9g00001729 [Holotrichia oblita]|uniref:Uncharacterized protein n=1 Tax=Holotrichia oblita TaxID=644536 RepID=A0ACB9SM77_HOLOL|nr:hypothetical protein MML48_9g00001729 [Holotrichia oblita]